MELKIDTDFIRLDSALKLSGLVDTGGMAKNIIQNEGVLVNDKEEFRRGRKLHKGDKIVLYDQEILIT